MECFADAYNPTGREAMSIKSTLLKYLAEPVEDLAEGIIEAAVEELDEQYTAYASGKIDKALAEIAERLPGDAGAVLLGASILVKPILLDLLADGGNELVEYVWRKTQEINPRDKTSPAPQIGGE